LSGFRRLGGGGGQVRFGGLWIASLLFADDVVLLASSDRDLRHSIFNNRRIGAATAVKEALHRTVLVKRKLSRKAKLSMYWSVYLPTLTHGHELWAVTERKRLWIQAAEKSFLRKP